MKSKVKVTELRPQKSCERLKEFKLTLTEILFTLGPRTDPVLKVMGAKPQTPTETFSSGGEERKRMKL